MSKITIIGAGNGGVTAAYHFSKIGHDVCLYDQVEFDKQIKAIEESGGVKAIKNVEGVNLILHGFEHIKKVTTSIREAIEYSSMIVMIVPSFAQEKLFELMLPYLSNNHILFSMPGNFASLVLENKRKKMGYNDLEMTYVDAMTIPWACRLFEPGTIGIMGIKEFIYAGVLPKNKESQVLNKN